MSGLSGISTNVGKISSSVGNLAQSDKEVSDEALDQLVTDTDKNDEKAETVEGVDTSENTSSDSEESSSGESVSGSSSANESESSDEGDSDSDSSGDDGGSDSEE